MKNVYCLQKKRADVYNKIYESSDALWNYIREFIEKNVDAGLIEGEGSGEQTSPL